MLYLLQLPKLNCSANLHVIKYVSIHKPGIKLYKTICLKGYITWGLLKASFASTNELISGNMRLALIVKKN